MVDGAMVRDFLEQSRAQCYKTFFRRKSRCRNLPKIFEGLIKTREEMCRKLSFTKWRGRNFVGFVEFPSFPLTYMQKKNSVVVLRWFVFVCVSVCLSVCPSVRLSPQKSAVTFDPLDRSARNFQGPLTSWQVIFGRVMKIVFLVESLRIETRGRE